MWALQESNIFAYDTETNGEFDRFRVGLVGMSFCYNENVSYYVPFNHDTEEKQIDLSWALPILKELLEDESIEKICHNAKFDEMVLRRYDIDVNGAGNDTYIMAWLLAEDSSSRGLKSLVERIFGVEMETYEDVVSATPKKKGIPRDYNFARVSLDNAVSYAADDAYWTYLLYRYFEPQLAGQKLWGPYANIERPFVRTLRKLEDRGVYVDKEYMAEADEKLPKIIEQVEGAIYEEAGEVFNIGSGKQLGHILFEKLGIGNNVPVTKTGNYSTDQKTLSTYATNHQIVENVLRRKKIQKTHSVFVEGIKGYIGKDNRVHPSFNGSGTVTGRLSCSSPNLQQIEGDEVESIKVRNFFIPAPGYEFVVADYSQIELRLMAHFSKDKYMIESFLSGRDFHEEVARRMFKVPDDIEVTRKQRVVAKTLNFGVGYGRGPTGISEQLGISMSEARQFIKDWFDTFAGVGAYQKHVVALAREQGFVRTLAGRKRRLLPDIRSDDWMLRGRAERQAFNTKIQGSAADLIKLAMIALDTKLKPLDAAMCIQIHDELVIESRIANSGEVLEVVKETMELPLNGKNPLCLPLVVDPKIVKRWGDAK